VDVNAESSPLPPANRDGRIDQDWAGDDQDWWPRTSSAYGPGNPLSERKLAQMFGSTSRRWARARIAETRRIPAPALAANRSQSLTTSG
jgi:hypothetical protein